MPVPPDQFHVRGKFGPVVNWPLIPLHVLVLPDGRLMSYGSDGKGRQSGLEIYDIWDAQKGTGPESHLTLPNTTGADIFCNGQILFPAGESVLLIGGDRTVNGVRNWSSAKVSAFNYSTNDLTSTGRDMSRPRWYPTVTTLSNGDVLVLGGRLDPEHFAPTPEVYRAKTGWSVLQGATSDEAFGFKNWDYPRAWQTSRGNLIIISSIGEMFSMAIDGEGSVRKLNTKLRAGHDYLPSLMYAPDKVLSLRTGGTTYKVDIGGADPFITKLEWFGIARYNATGTVMADGSVFINGGGLRQNSNRHHILANRVAMIWNPIDEKITMAAVHQKDRLYHSTALLLQDATVFTGGGGAGGVSAENQLNAEIFYPPYLYDKNGTGQLASRPVIEKSPDFIHWAQTFRVLVNADISRLTLVKLGSATHAQVFDQRFLDLKFVKKQAMEFVAMAPAGGMVAPPGYYFLFAFDQSGVPSMAKIVRLDN